MLRELEKTLLPYLTPTKTIGVFVSGGLDSAVLLATCAYFYQTHNLHCMFSTYTVPQGLDAKWSKNVIDWIESKYPIKFDRSIVGDPTLPHDQRILDALHTVKAECDHLVFGDTCNPPEVPGGSFREISASDRYLQPFVTWTKDRVIRLGLELGVEDLMHISNSCNLDNNCGHCWACRERAWAFHMVAIAGIEPATNGV